MILEQQFYGFVESTKPNKDEINTQNKLIKIIDNNLSTCEGFEVAKYWFTARFTRHSDVGRINQFDLFVLLDTDKSERDLPKIFHNCLNDIATKTVLNNSVRLEIDNNLINVFPTKYAQQGTIGRKKDEPIPFSTIIGESKIFKAASRLLQHWQINTGLDPDTQSLCAFEIEIILRHISTEYSPKSVKNFIKLFFQWANKYRFNQQISIFDKHDNILLYHNFNIPEKQIYLEKIFDTHNKLENNNFGSLFVYP